MVGQQPFGGARASGTNDKAGSKINLLRWVSARDDQGDVLAAARVHLPVYVGGVRRPTLKVGTLRRAIYSIRISSMSKTSMPLGLPASPL